MRFVDATRATDVVVRFFATISEVYQTLKSVYYNTTDLRGQRQKNSLYIKIIIPPICSVVLYIYIMYIYNITKFFIRQFFQIDTTETTKIQITI